MTAITPNTAKTIALVEDDSNLLRSLALALQNQGFMTRVYRDGHMALQPLLDNPPDIAICDIKMPRMDGLELLSRLREKIQIPIILLTSKDDENDEEIGLENGADDYITKPFSQRLLIARIRALLRRVELENQAIDGAQADITNIVTRGNLTLDAARHKIFWKGEAVALTVSEFLILEKLASHPGVVRSRTQLMEAAYQSELYIDDRTIDSHIKRLRSKFRMIDSQFNAIRTLYGAGYHFIDESGG